MEISVEEAFELLIDGKTIMVSNDEDDDLMECNVEYILEHISRLSSGIIYLSDDDIEEVYDYLQGKERLEVWE